MQPFLPISPPPCSNKQKSSDVYLELFSKNYTTYPEQQFLYFWFTQAPPKNWDSEELSENKIFVLFGIFKEEKPYF